MKIYTTLLIFTFFLINLFSQKKDSLVFTDSTKNVFAYKNKLTELIIIKNAHSKNEINNIQYFKIYDYNNDVGKYFRNDDNYERFYQTIDNVNHKFYDSSLTLLSKFDLNEIEKYREYCCHNFYWTDYSIKKQDSFFILNTKYDDASKEKKINKNDTIKQNFDKLLFIDGYTEISTGGYDLYRIFSNESHTTLIFSQNGKMGFLNNSTILYDSIFYNRAIILNKDSLYSYYSTSQTPKYKRLDEFKYGLAYFELPNGVVGYIDEIGKEYFKHKKRITKK